MGPPWLKFLWFLKTGRTGDETDQELRDERLGRRTPPPSGIVTLFIAFVALAIIAKLVMQALTGDSFDLSVEGLVTGYAFLWFAGFAAFAIVILRKLFLWRYGGAEPSHEYERGGGCGMVVLIIVGVVGLLTLYIRHSYEASLKQQAVLPANAAPEPAPDDRKPLIARLDVLYSEVNLRWRADMISAGAIGDPGQIPPMLGVTAKGTDVWQVRNLARTPACVRLVRVTESPDKRLNRCRLDANTECVEISAGTSRQLSLTPADDTPGCRGARLEYRVGTPMLPEPSWWSATAMVYEEAPDALRSKSHESWTAARLRSEITLLESLPEERNRATRWRRELDDLAHRAKP